ncbi:hypothetical protein N7G274_007721 [Stereocaulon virgatum]|uniref:Uncharacterized protein n=1 Tax=Stereocaulon virgatum TaxID=373712 RepID=A0ABR4A0I5_9LECA
MQYFNILLIGLVSLASTISAKGAIVNEATKDTAATNLKDRAELEARQAHKARLARKFDLAARDHIVAVTVTSVPASCTAGPQESAIAQASMALSEASVAIAQAGSVTTAAPAIPPAASIALSEASAFLSSIAATPVVAPPVFANVTIVPGTNAPSVAPATGKIGALPTSPSPTPTSLATGAASESKNINEVILMIIMGLMGNIALMV